MEPFTAAGTILGVVDVALRTTSSLVKYAIDTKNASSDRKILAEEAQLLSKILKKLRDHAQSSGQDEKWLADHGEAIKQFEAAYDDLVLSLKIDPATGKRKEESRLKAFRSATAWSFTKFEVYTLLERISRLQQYANMLLADEQYILVERMDQKQQEALDQKLKMSLLSWLSPLQMTQVHQTISDRAQKGSGNWFVTSEKFLDWRNGGEKSLWCWGIPGAGKTVLASVTVNHLRRDRAEESKSSIGIAVVYLKYNEPEQTLENILASLLKQLTQEHDFIHSALLKLYERHQERNTPPSLDEVFETLSSVVQAYTEMYFIIDGLDECSEEVRWGLVERLQSFEPKLHLMITSRYLDSIAEELEGFSRFEIKANKVDIELFIDHQIRKNRNLRKIIYKSPSLRQDMKVAVVKTAENMFLLARLHVESLTSAAGLSIRHIRQKLQTLPTTLSGTYDAAMERIENQEQDHRDIAFKALAWLSYAFRSLSLRELQHALAIEPGDTVLDDETIMDGQSITALCAGLVVVDQGTNVVNLVHYTTKNYFEKTRSTYFPNFHASITLGCATYLTLDALKDATIWELVQGFPLACYAAQYMGDHARQSPEESLESSVLEVICQLLSHPDKRKPLLSLLDGLALIQSGFYSSNTSASQIKDEAATYDAESELRTLFETAINVSDEALPLTERPSLGGRSERSSSTSTTTGDSVDSVTLSGSEGTGTALWESKMGATRIPEVTALHLAASMGLAKIASMLLSDSPNIDAVDETGKTALAVAMERGFEKAVEFLLNSGACVDLSNIHGRAVLLLIAERSWQNAGKIIVEKFRSLLVEDDDTGISNWLRFLIAAYEGDVARVQKLAGTTFDPRSRADDIGATALFVAVEHEDLKLVQELVTAGMDLELKDATGKTSLHRATRRQNEAMMRLLIKNGADIDSKDDDGRTAWSAHLRSCDKRILRILLDSGADPSTRGLQGVSELYTAGKEGDIECVRYMLESGTKPSIKTNYDWTPLHWAASDGHIECTQLLLNAGANPSALSDQSVTPLDLCLQTNQIEAVEILVRAGAKQGKDVGEWVGEWADTAKSIQLHEAIAPVAATKLTLVWDVPLIRILKNKDAVGQFIYPFNSEVSKGSTYQVSHVLETSASSLSIRRTDSRAAMSKYPLNPEDFLAEDVIYDIRRITLDYHEFELQPKGTDLLPGIIKMNREWTGGWKIYRHYKEASDYLFRTTPDWSSKIEGDCRWMTENGHLLARTGREDKTPNICFEEVIDKEMQDVLVSCWAAKLWSETVVH
ncbi:hypothetical protein MMC11_004714 [Xylographa trunciseda]|nr:hypothetical protein [Xylographa trunciseda]